MRLQETLAEPLQEFFAELLNKKISTVEQATTALVALCEEFDLGASILEELHLEADFRLLCEMAVVLAGREDDGLLTEAVKELLRDYPANYRENQQLGEDNQPAKKILLLPKENDEHLLYLQDIIKALQDGGLKYTINKMAISVYLKEARHFEYNKPYYDPSTQQVYGELVFLKLPRKEQLSFLPAAFVAGKMTGDRPGAKLSYITPLTPAEFNAIVLNLKYDWEQETYRLDQGE